MKRNHLDFLFNSSLTVSLLVACYLLVMSIVFPMIGPDTGFYLKTSLEFSRGTSILEELVTLYNPLAFLQISMIFSIVDKPSIELIYVFNYAYYTINLYLYYLLCEKIGLKGQSLIASLITMFSSTVLLDGLHVMLEPFLLVHILVATLLIVTYNSYKKLILLLLSGFFVALAFFVKQYAILYLISILVYFLILRKSYSKGFREAIVFTMGFLITFAIVVTVTSLTTQLNIIESVERYLGISAIRVIAAPTGAEYKATDILGTILYLSVRFTYLVLFPIIIVRFWKKIIEDENLLLLIIITLGFTAQLFFANHDHYVQLLMPFAIIFIFLSRKYFWQENQLISIILAVSFTLFAVYGVMRAGVLTERRNGMVIEQQFVSAKLATLVPKGSQVFLEGISPAYYYIMDYNSLDKSRLGYTFSNTVDFGKVLEVTEPGDFLILSEKTSLALELEEYWKVKGSMHLPYSNKDIIILQLLP